MKNLKRELFVGIDLGGKEKKTTGICILERKNGKIFFSKDYCKFCKVVYGKEILKKLRNYLEETRVIALDAPLTKGRGKGKMRLYEKFLSTKIFRKAEANPIPPALMPDFCRFAETLAKKLEKNGFVLDLNLIEAFPTLLEKISGQNLYLKTIGKKPMSCKSENQKSALICAILAFLHFNFKTRYLGYKDGFLFLPEISFWKKSWQRKFLKIWRERSRLKYKRLITNIFE